MPEKGDIIKGILIAGVVLGGGYWLYKRIRRGTGSAGPSQPIDLTFANKARDDLIAKLALKPGDPGERGKIDRHRAFFIYRRVRDLGIADPLLREGLGLEASKQRVELELGQVNAFLEEKLGTSSDDRGAYFGGPAGPEPRHLDLGRYTHERFMDPPATTEAEAVAAPTKSEAQTRTLRELDRRRMRVIGIVWRAAAIESDIWEGTGTSSTLQPLKLTEILDRRLRTVERLQYEASAGVTLNGNGLPHIDRDELIRSNESDSPLKWRWMNDFNARIFEAPSIPRAAKFSDGNTVEDVLTSGQVVLAEVDAGRERFHEVFQKGWYQNYATDQFDWNTWPGTRIKPPIFTLPDPEPIAGQPPRIPFNPPQWALAPTANVGYLNEVRGYAWVMTPTRGSYDDPQDPQPPRQPVGSGSAAVVIQDLFTPRSTALGDRSWLHSDGVMAALNLEALRFGKLRREGTDTIFDALWARYALDDYFGVRRGVAASVNGIMKWGRTDHFENSAIPSGDLQIGDQVLFETSPVLFVLGSSNWEYSTGLVTELDSEADNTLDLGRVRIQGFGTPDLDYGAFQLLLLKGVDATLQNVRKYVTSEFPKARLLPAVMKWGAGIVEFIDFAELEILRMWNPYGDTWDDPGPWWIVMDLRLPKWSLDHIVDDAAVLKILAKAPGGIWPFADDQLKAEFRGGAVTIATGQGYQRPASLPESAVSSDAVLVPLFEPDGGWISYFLAKAANPSVKVPSRLNPVRSDAAWVPGLARHAENIRVIRPRLEPPAS